MNNAPPGSPKVCAACGKQARGIDSRQRSGSVWRRYACTCGAPNWTTIETRVETDYSVLQKEKDKLADKLAAIVQELRGVS